MLNKIKNIFKDEELEKEIQDLRQNQEILEKNLSEKEFIYSELLRINTQTIQKNKDLEESLVQERERNQKLKDEYITKIVKEMDLNKELKNEKQELEKQILDLKAEFPKLEAAYSEEYQNRLKAKLKIEEEKFKEKVLELQNEYSVYFIKETEKFKLKLESVEKEKNELYVKDKEVQKKFEKEKSELQEMLVLEKSAKENLLKEIVNLKEKMTNLEELEEKLTEKESLYLSESLSKENLEKSLELIEKEKSELQETLEQEKNKKLKMLEEIESLKNDILKFEEAYSNEILDKKKVLKELKDLEIVYENLEEDIEKEIKQKESLDEELIKAKIEIEKYRSKEYKMTKLNEKLLEEIKKVELEIENKNILIEELDKTKKQNLELLNEIELLKSSVNLNFIDEKEGPEVQITQNLFLGKWADKKQFIKNKNSLIDLLKKFDLDDFNEMYLEGEKRGVLKYSYEKGLSNIISRLKLDLILTQSTLERVIPFYIELMNSLEETIIVDYLNQNLILELGEWSARKKYISSKKDPVNTILKFNLKDFKDMYSFSNQENILLESEAKYLLYIIKWLENKKPLIYLDLEKISKVYIKIIGYCIENQHNFETQKIKKEIKQSIKKEFNISIKDFKIQDFKEFYLEAQKINFLNSLEERHLLNIISLLEDGRDIFTLNLERVNKSYQNFRDILNKSDIKNLNIKYDVESYTAKDYFFIYEELKKNKIIPKWFRLFVLNLGRQKEEGLEITEYQYKILRSYYLELDKIIKKRKIENIIEYKCIDLVEEEKENNNLENYLDKDLIDILC